MAENFKQVRILINRPKPIRVGRDKVLKKLCIARVLYNGYYDSFPRSRRRFDSAHPLQAPVAQWIRATAF